MDTLQEGRKKKVTHDGVPRCDSDDDSDSDEDSDNCWFAPVCMPYDVEPWVSASCSNLEIPTISNDKNNLLDSFINVKRNDSQKICEFVDGTRRVSLSHHSLTSMDCRGDFSADVMRLLLLKLKCEVSDPCVAFVDLKFCHVLRDYGTGFSAKPGVTMESDGGRDMVTRLLKGRPPMSFEKILIPLRHTSEHWVFIVIFPQAKTLSFTAHGMMMVHNCCI